MSAGKNTDLPDLQALPGREPDADLDLAALDAVRARIDASLHQTQGAWHRLPRWRRAWPLVAAIVVAGVWAVGGIADGAIEPSAVLCLLASIGAAIAVGLSTTTPRRGEYAALAALGVAAGALMMEVATAAFAPLASDPLGPGGGNTDVTCASAICFGAALPLALVALHLWLARTPARLLHVVAVAGVGFFASMASVWAHCPATELGHVLRSHALAPLVVGAVLIVALRLPLRGPRAR